MDAESRFRVLAILRKNADADTGTQEESPASTANGCPKAARARVTSAVAWRSIASCSATTTNEFILAEVRQRGVGVDASRALARRAASPHFRFGIGQ